MDTPAGVRARIDSYRPQCLSPQHWELAADTVRDAVASVHPTPGGVKDIAGALCRFLSCSWAPAATEPPDLVALLSTAAIDFYTANPPPMPHPQALSTRVKDHGYLLRVAKGVGGTLTPRQPGRPHTGKPVPQGLTAAAVPLTVMAEAWSAATGLRSFENALRASIGDLCTQPHTVAPAAVLALADTRAVEFVPPGAPAAEPAPAPQVSTSVTKSPQRSSPTPMSRAAALRHARDAKAATDKLNAGPVLAADPDPQSLPDDVRAAIADYRPRIPAQDWAEIHALTERLLIGFAPPTPNAARNAATHISAFVHWMRHWPGRAEPAAPLTALELLRPGLVELYIGQSKAPTASKATHRSVLRRAIGSLTVDPTGVRLARDGVSAPYTTADCARFVRLATTQPTASRRRGMCVVIGLGLGAGLAGRDLRSIRRHHVRDIQLPDGSVAVAVDVPGDRRRTVVVARHYEHLVRTALTLHDDAGRGPHALLLGAKETRTNITGPVIGRAVTARDNERLDIDTNRLRHTWLVAAMCAPMPLADLLVTSGLRSARSFTELLRYCPLADPAAVAELLASLQARTTDGQKCGDCANAPAAGPVPHMPTNAHHAPSLVPVTTEQSQARS